MKIRLHGTEDECREAAGLLHALGEVLAVSGPYPDRGRSRLVRVYAEVRPRPRRGACAMPGGAPRMSGLMFYLGAHQPHWLWNAGFPLFVSHRTLRKRKSLRPATCRWALDSGGFTELSLHGRWTESPRRYAAAVRRYRDEIGRMDFAAPQDWMCEPGILAKTGLPVREHQRQTTGNLLELRSIAADLPWIAVVQGWKRDDYLRHRDMYEAAGIDLAAEPLAGLGSVCRRQSTAEIAVIVAALADRGLRMHGFGVKAGGLHPYGHRLASADSMAWSYTARRLPALPACTGHRNCANCLAYATSWRRRVLHSLSARGCQGDLFTGHNWPPAPSTQPAT